MTTNTRNATIVTVLILLSLGTALLLRPAKVETPVVTTPTENITLSGVYTFCVKQDNFSTSEECIEGIKTDDNMFYTLDFALMSASKPELKNDETITVQGVLVNGKLSVTQIISQSSKPLGPKESATGKCYVGGCSGQVCSSEEGMVSTCEFRPEYQCYKSTGAVCERQVATGKCGWTPSEKLNMCLDSASFEGEADPNVMKLDMKTWNWESALYSDGKKIVPVKKVFSLTFKNDGAFGAKTDCNSAGGKYTVKENLLTFSDIFSTEMACENSQEADFIKLLTNTSSYHFTGKGELILDLKFDSGTVTFR